MNVRYRVELGQVERDQLSEMLSGGKHAARKLKRAQILLAADAGMSDAVIAASVSVGESTVYRTKRRLVERNLELALLGLREPVGLPSATAYDGRASARNRTKVKPSTGQKS